MPAALPMPETGVPRTRLPPWLRAVCAILPVAATAAVGSVATQAEIPGWYASLNKPSYNPPDWVFPVAWTVLYTMIAISLWRLLGAHPRMGPARAGWWLALCTFLVQLALNAIWTPVFFTYHAVGAGLVVVGALLVMVLWTIRLTWRYDAAAAWLLVPYAVWVAFATLLNAVILRMN